MPTGITFEVPATLPRPVGWQLLLALPKAPEKIGSIHLPSSESDKLKAAAVICKVVGMGAEAYADKEKFPRGAWCKIGDFVIIPRYAGSRIKIGDTEMRLLNDADILATADQPELIGLAA